MKILIVGSSGFIGSNLAKRLKEQGHWVVGHDIVEPRYFEPDEFYNIDWRKTNYEEGHFSYYDSAYCLACLFGGMGFIGDEEKHGYEMGVGSTQIICNFIESFRGTKAKIFYSSSACVYNQELQKSSKVIPLKESDAIPASPDLLYGWQKLYAEKMFMASGLNVRIARFHNIFGKWGVWDGGKEKAPAALCRKVAMAKDGDEIEVWGNGLQTRSFLHINECLEGVERLMRSDFIQPLNIGSDELVSINHLAQMIIDISGKKLTIKNVEGNVGVQGRNSDNTLCYQTLGWKPSSRLVDGLRETYNWINEQINGRV